MSCQRFEEELLLREVGALPAWRRWALDRHLSRCSACRRRQASMAKTVDAYAAAIHPERRRPRSPRLQPTIPALLAGLIVLLVLGVVLYKALSVSPIPQVDRPCRPDLPSDACR